LQPLFREIGEVVIAGDSGIGASHLHDVSLIYSNTITNGNFLGMQPYGNIPILTHVHEMDYVIELHGSDNIREVKRHTVHFISCSKAAAAALTRSQGIDAARISVVPGSVSPSDILGKSKTKSPFEIRKSLYIDEKAFVILGCGTRDLRKGIDLYIQLASFCARNKQPGRRLEFLWIGSTANDPVSDILLRDIRKLGAPINLQFLGELENPYPYIAAADLFCLPSREDPFPLVMLEAGALGKPTLAFKEAGGAEEYCLQGAGFLVPYLDVAGMGNWILDRFADGKLVSKAGRKAEKLIRQKYTMDATGPQYVHLIERFMRPDAAPASGISQLFIPSATGYSEKASIRKQVPASRWNRMSFDFRARGPNNSWVVRFDPLDRTAAIEIAKIILKSSGRRTLWKADAPEDFNAIRVEGSAIRLPDTKVLKLLSIGSDPVLCLPELEIKEKNQGFRLEIVMRADNRPEVLASHWQLLRQAYSEYNGLRRNVEQMRSQLSVAFDKIEKLGMALLSAGTSIKGRTIYIWGTGAAGRHMGEVMVRQGHKFRGFIDRDPKKEGQKSLEHPIFAPGILNRKAGKKPFIIIGSQFHPQISRRLKKMGFTQKTDFAPSPFL
jgi:glycosyltransferase involved in cell wall biosynthesis